MGDPTLLRAHLLLTDPATLRDLTDLLLPAAHTDHHLLRDLPAPRDLRDLPAQCLPPDLMAHLPHLDLTHPPDPRDLPVLPAHLLLSVLLLLPAPWTRWSFRPLRSF